MRFFKLCICDKMLETNIKLFFFFPCFCKPTELWKNIIFISIFFPASEIGLTTTCKLNIEQLHKFTKISTTPFKICLKQGFDLWIRTLHEKGVEIMLLGNQASSPRCNSSINQLVIIMRNMYCLETCSQLKKQHYTHLYAELIRHIPHLFKKKKNKKPNLTKPKPNNITNKPSTKTSK